MIDSKSNVSRRQLLGGGAAVAGLTALSSVPAFAEPTDSETFAAMRAAWNDQLTGGDFDPAEPALAAAVARLDAQVQPYLDDIERSAERIRVFTSLPLTEQDSGGDSRSMRETIVRLQYLAIAYRTRGSRFEGDAGLLADVLAGLETWNRVVYNEDQPEYDKLWWQWEIGASRPLASACTLLYDHIPAEARERYLAAIDHFVPDPRYNYLPGDPRQVISTGANRIDLCQAMMVRGVAGDRADLVTKARDALAETFVFSDRGDGVYRDGSFIQHKWIAYNGGYGMVFLAGNLRQLVLLTGSPWDLTEAERGFLFEITERAYIPLIHNAQMPSMVKGRTLSRHEVDEHSGGGHGVPDAMLQLAKIADPATAARWRSIAKGWLQRDTWDDPLADASVNRAALITELLADNSVQPADAPAGTTMFAGMARAMHRGPSWALAIAMANKRVAFYETLNGENRKGWHTGAGATYLYDDDGGQFSDAYWPTVDPYRIPGTTIDKQPLPHRPNGSYPRTERTAWTGGAVLDGKYSAVGMDVEGIVSPLRGKKSWFCFDEFVVALGAGITGSSGHPVETVVENRCLHTEGQNRLTVDGTAQPGTQGWTDRFDNPSWAHLEGVGGFVFPDSAALHALREERTGTWADITTNIPPPPDPITRRYLTLWFDHGVEPSNAKYAYLLAPGVSAARTAELADDPGNAQILSNTSRIQAVRIPRLGVTAANFWTAGTVDGIALGAGGGLELPTIEVDDRDPGFKIISGGWSTSEGDLRYLGRQRHHGPGQGGAVARFTLNVPATGRYSVRAWWFAHENRATNTPYKIKHANGTTTVRVNQRVDGSAWNELGRFDFTKGGDHYIEVSNADVADGLVIADAVRLAPIGVAPCSLILQERASELEVAVAEPTHESTGFTVRLDRAGYRSWTADDTITVTRLGPQIQFVVNTRGAAGATHTVTFRRT